MIAKEAKGTDTVDQKNKLVQAIISKKATVGIIGLGYVGLPLAQAVVNRGYKCIGFDKSEQRIKKLNDGQTYIKTLSDEDIISLNESKRFFPTVSEKDVAKMDIILICVPTPLTKNREPDMSYVCSATKLIVSQLRKGQMIVLESTTYPGTTQELLAPMLEAGGMKIGSDIYLAYSPEREDPGNMIYNASSIPKVVGADDDDSRDVAINFYKQIIAEVAEVSTAATAEAVKLTENIFRFVNIALVNELKCIFDKMDIDIWEVIDAAKTKPFGYMPFYPGPGLGGHCIPIDPFYLTWRAREFDMPTQLVELSGNINRRMGDYVVEKLRKEMDLRFAKGLRDSKILVMGVAYKKNVDDLRESPSLTIMQELLDSKAKVDYYDPLISTIHDHDYPELSGMSSISVTNAILQSYEAIVVCTDHDVVDYKAVIENSNLIIDTRNVFKNKNLEGDNVVKA